MTQFNFLFRIVYSELSKAIFYYRHPHFFLKVEDFVLQSKKVFDSLEAKNRPDNKEDTVAGRVHLLEKAKQFAQELVPNQNIQFKDVYEWSSLIFYAAIVLLKVFFLDRVRQCANDTEFENVTPEQVLNINYTLAKAFSKCSTYTNICSEHCPKYFLNRLLDGEDLQYIECACQNFLSFNMPDTMPSPLLQHVLNGIVQKLLKKSI